MIKYKTLPVAFLLIVLSLFKANTSVAQINIPADSVNKLLCHKWGFKAILMGGQRLTNMNESITYEFLADGTLKRIASNGKTEKGTWAYMIEKKIISLSIKKIALFIPVLSNDELIIMAGEGAPGDGAGVGTVLKPIEDY